MSKRNKLLIRLIEASGNIEAIVADLKTFSWDSETALVTLTRPDVIRILERYLEERLAADSIEYWANAVEGREDIKYETRYEDVLGEAIHQLANPLLTEPLSVSSAHDLIETLR